MLERTEEVISNRVREESQTLQDHAGSPTLNSVNETIKADGDHPATVNNYLFWSMIMSHQSFGNTGRDTRSLNTNKISIKKSSLS